MDVDINFKGIIINTKIFVFNKISPDTNRVFAPEIDRSRFDLNTAANKLIRLKPISYLHSDKFKLNSIRQWMGRDRITIQNLWLRQILLHGQDLVRCNHFHYRPMGWFMRPGRWWWMSRREKLPRKLEFSWIIHTETISVLHHVSAVFRRQW